MLNSNTNKCYKKTRIQNLDLYKGNMEIQMMYMFYNFLIEIF